MLKFILGRNWSGSGLQSLKNKNKIDKNLFKSLKNYFFNSKNVYIFYGKG